MKPKDPVSPREEEILSFIAQYCQERGYPPTVREIGKAVGLHSSCSVHYHLCKLEEKGFIRRKAAKPRAIELVSSSEHNASLRGVVFLPLLRGVSQDRGSIRLEFTRTFLPFPRHFVGEGECFVFRVHDGAFSRWHILEGDYLLVKQGKTFEGEALVFLVSQGRIFLERTTPWDDASVNSGDIIGKVVGVWRRL